MLCCLFNPKHDARNFLPLYTTRKVDEQQMHHYKPQKNNYTIRMTHWSVKPLFIMWLKRLKFSVKSCIFYIFSKELICYEQKPRKVYHCPN